MSSTLAMLDFFKDGEKAFSNFSAFLESNYDIRSSNTVRMTFATLCKWKLLYEVDFKTYTLTAAGADLLKTHSETSLGRQIQNSTLYFGEILQELETEVPVSYTHLVCIRDRNMYLWMSFWQPVISSVFTARLQKKPNTSSMKKLSPK